MRNSCLNNEQLAGYYGTKLGKKQINILWIINECISHDNNHAQELEINKTLKSNPRG